MYEPEIRFETPDPLNWSELFGRDAPVELELGFGRARWIIASASERPEVDFFGVEYSRKYFREGRQRVLAAERPNLRICRAEGLDFLVRRVPPGSLSALHVYHPDPWPKKRHRKRRIITPVFMAQAARCLAAGALLRITTDHADYSEDIAEILGAAPDFTALDWEDETPDTHFAAKYIAAGREIHRFLCRRKETA